MIGMSYYERIVVTEASGGTEVQLVATAVGLHTASSARKKQVGPDRATWRNCQRPRDLPSRLSRSSYPNFHGAEARRMADVWIIERWLRLTARQVYG